MSITDVELRAEIERIDALADKTPLERSQMHQALFATHPNAPTVFRQWHQDSLRRVKLARQRALQ